MDSAAEKAAVGVVGLGRMGAAIASRLHATGHKVYGWNRSARPVPPGIVIMEDLAGLVGQCQVVITSLYDDIAVGDVLGRLCNMDVAGRMVVETSTVSPETIRTAMPALEKAGARVLDAPISGGPELVCKGAAGMFVGAAVADYAAWKPLGALLAPRISHIGPIGAGAAAKMVNNMMLVGYWQTLKEALQTGKRAGLTLETMLNVIAEGPAASGAFKGRLPVILGENDTVGFSTQGLVKDAKLFADVGAGLGVDTPAIKAAVSSFEFALKNGLKDTDFARMLAQAYDMA